MQGAKNASVIGYFPDRGFVESSDEAKVYGIPSPLNDLFCCIDILGDTLALDLCHQGKRRFFVGNTAGMMPVSKFGLALQHLVLSRTGGQLLSDDDVYCNINGKGSGVVMRLSSELLVMKERMVSGGELRVLDFNELACLARCCNIAKAQGLMIW